MEREDGVPNRFYRPDRMNSVHSRVVDILPIALLLILWWIGVWGFVDTSIQLVTKGNPLFALGIYGGIIGSILLIVSLRPQLLEHFI